MASSYKQQALQRKLIYLGLVAVLFTTAWVWRKYVVEEQANELALREQNMGEVEVTGLLARHTLIGFRGIATCALWMDAIEKKKKNQWNELELVTRAATRLQPHFITPWQFQSWNLTYNVSVESDRIRDKYFWVTRGVLLMAEGERQNRFSPALRRDIGQFQEHKICRSDENNVMRSIFQLSCIPPKDRDSERFWDRGADGKIKRLSDGSRAIKVEVFKEFCRAHPQLIRRLLAPPLVNDPRREFPRFRCGTAQEVVDFLADHSNVPSLFAEKGENPLLYEERLAKPAVEDRFPVLPPERQIRFTDYPGTEWTDANVLTREPERDSFDAYNVSRAWFGYAMELVPPPSKKLPTENGPIEDRVRQRIPKKMETILFRIGPARAQKDVAERLAEEGWFDQEPWNTGVEYEKGGSEPEIELTLGGEQNRNWSQRAWDRSHQMWERFGRRNLILLDESELKNKQQLSEEYRRRYGIGTERVLQPEKMDEEQKNPEDERMRQATLFLQLYGTARSLTNYPFHLLSAKVERLPETVAARKDFYVAERTRRNKSSLEQALVLFDRAAQKWREVLRKYPEFRDNEDINRQTFEYELKYIRQYADLYGNDLKQHLALQSYLTQALGGAAGSSDWAVLSLFAEPKRMPPITVYGPFAEDENGEPYYTDMTRASSLRDLRLSPKAAKTRRGRNPVPDGMMGTP